MKAMIQKIKKIAQGTLLVEFELEKVAEFQPGQYFYITLINPPFSDARGPTRHFSIVNTPGIKNTLVMATRLRESAFKKSLQQLPPGTEVEIGKIDGHFTLPEDPFKPLVFIAGGIGITPFMSMIQYVYHENLPYNITLIYSNRDQVSTAFLNELKQLNNELSNFKLILTMTEDPQWQEEKRMVDAGFINQYLKEPNLYTFMVAGPPGMVEQVYEEIKKTGVEDKNIITENFSGY